MKEARLSYLCTRAAQDAITIEEFSELIDYAIEWPEVFALIEIEKMLWQGQTALTK